MSQSLPFTVHGAHCEVAAEPLFVHGAHCEVAVHPYAVHGGRCEVAVRPCAVHGGHCGGRSAPFPVHSVHCEVAVRPFPLHGGHCELAVRATRSHACPLRRSRAARRLCARYLALRGASGGSACVAWRFRRERTAAWRALPRLQQGERRHGVRCLALPRGENGGGFRLWVPPPGPCSTRSPDPDTSLQSPGNPGHVAGARCASARGPGASPLRRRRLGTQGK
jgi:hypothetical protein